LALTLVVHPVSVVLCKTVPVEIAGNAEAVIVFETVGFAVPVAIFQTSMVSVPASTSITQPTIAQAKGTV
jgi:hypothetical protein